MKFLPYIFIIVLAGVAIGMVNKARYEIDEARREVDVTRDVVSSLVSQLEEQRRGFELLKEESKILQNEFLRADNVSKKISQDIDFAQERSDEILREAKIKATNVSQIISLELDLVQVRSSEILLEAQRKADNVSQSVSLELDKAQESSDKYYVKRMSPFKEPFKTSRRHSRRPTSSRSGLTPTILRLLRITLRLKFDSNPLKIRFKCILSIDLARHALNYLSKV